MFTLRPGETFPIVRGLPDHTDSATYYVRAVVKNARTDAVLDTLDLEDKGSRYFAYQYQVPSDASGEGFYLSVVTSVYTDSGYTTKSDSYGDEFNTYLVAARPNEAQILGGGGGGPDISYKKIRELMDESVKNIIKQMEARRDKEKAEMDEARDLLLDAVLEAKRAVDGISIPQPERIDFNPVLKALGGAETSIKSAISQVKAPEVDYKRIEESADRKIREVMSSNESLFRSFQSFLEKSLGVIKDFPALEKTLKSINDFMTGFDKRFSVIYKVATSQLNGMKDLAKSLDETAKPMMEAKPKAMKPAPWYRNPKSYEK